MSTPPPLPVAAEPMPWRLWHFFLALLGGIVTANVAFGVLAARAGSFDLDAVPADQIFGIVVPAQHIGTLAVVGVIVAAYRRPFAESLGLEIEVRDLRWVAVGVGASIVISLAMIPVAVALGLDDNPQSIADQFGDLSGGLSLLIAILVLVVFTPITEEILYRGVLLRAVGRRLPVAPTVVVTSILWGLAHLLDPGQGDAPWWAKALVVFIPITAFGVIAALVTIRSKGVLGPAVFLHSGWNLLGVVALLFGVA